MEPRSRAPLCRHLMIQGIRHFGPVVADIDQPVDWHCDKLGFEPEARWEMADAGVRFAHVAGHGVRFELFEASGSKPSPDEGADVFGALSTRGAKHVGLRVDDIEATRTQLERKGVEVILGPNDVPPVNMRNLFVRDLDGNRIEFVQVL